MTVTSKLVMRHFTECGREFKQKRSAIKHDLVCKCWSNPKHKTCKTCKHRYEGYDSNGMENDPAYLESWKTANCRKGIWEESPEWNQTHKNVDVNINCMAWKGSL